MENNYSSISKVNDFLNTENVKKQQSHKLGKFLALTATLTVVISSGIFLSKLNSNTTTDNANINSNNSASQTNNKNNNIITNLINSTKSAIGIKTFEYIPNRNSPLIKSEEQFERLRNIGGFSLDKNLKNNQIGRAISQVQFKDKEYFLSLVGEAEGFTSTFRNDNKGYAWGLGWNASFQSEKMNNNLINTISSNQYIVNQVTKLSGVFSEHSITDNYKNVTISPQQSVQAVELMKESYESAIIPAIAKQVNKNSDALKMMSSNHLSNNQMAETIYNNLKENEKAALVYHVYNLGARNFNKCEGLIKEVINLNFSKDKEQARKKVSEHFVTTYKYTENGVTTVKVNTRSYIEKATMFLSPEGWGAIIGSNIAPKDLSKQVPAIKQFNINIDKEGGLDLPDELGKMKENALAKGKVFNLDVQEADPGLKALHDNDGSLRGIFNRDNIEVNRRLTNSSKPKVNPFELR